MNTKPKPFPLVLLITTCVLTVALVISIKQVFTIKKVPVSQMAVEKTPKIATSDTTYTLGQPSTTPTPTPEVLSGFCLRVPIILYHHIQPWKNAKDQGQTALSVDNVVFDGQMNYLVSHGYNTITVGQLVNALRTHAQLPQKSIVITLDDGYKDAYKYAYPIFQKYHLVANLAIATGLLNGPDYISWSQLEEMARSGLISVLNHTWSHFSLPNGTSEKASVEIDTASQQIEQHTGQKNNTFVYPYGSFNNAIIGILQKKGFLAALSTNPGLIQCDSFIMSLHRTRIGSISLSHYDL